MPLVRGGAVARGLRRTWTLHCTVLLVLLGAINFSLAADDSLVRLWPAGIGPQSMLAASDQCWYCQLISWQTSVCITSAAVSVGWFMSQSMLELEAVTSGVVRVSSSHLENSVVRD